MKRSRLSRTVKSTFNKRRLDLVTEKNEMINDILQLGGEADLQVLASNETSYGESLSETLPSMSLPKLRRIHARLVTGELDIPFVEEF